MERCQGLPDRPCPDSRCDATVKNTIYDLFLCRQCELKRDAAKSSASSAVTSDSATVGATAADPLHATDYAAEVFAGADEPVIGKKTRRRQPARLGSAGRLTSTDADNNAAAEDNTSEIRQLKVEVCRLNSHICMLTTKLNFVL
jgi:capsid protein